MLIGCAMRKNDILVAHLDSKAEGRHFTDSLINAGVDTFLTYYDGCSGCIHGTTKPFYVYWVNNGIGYVTKFNELTNFNIVSKNFNVIYTVSLVEKLGKENLSQDSFTISHYGYEQIELRLGSKVIIYELRDYEKAANEISNAAILIDKFRAFLFSIPESDWYGLSYKRKEG